MGADIEHEIARLDELAVEPVHRGAVRAIAVIGAQRADDAAGGPQALKHGRFAARPAAAARSPRAPSRAARARATPAAARFPPAGGRARCARAPCRPTATT